MAASPSPLKRYLTLEQVADQFGISTRTCRRLIADGTLPAVRVGKRTLRVLQSDAEKLAHPVPTSNDGR